MDKLNSKRIDQALRGVCTVKSGCLSPTQPALSGWFAFNVDRGAIHPTWRSRVSGTRPIYAAGRTRRDPQKARGRLLRKHLFCVRLLGIAGRLKIAT